MGIWNLTGASETNVSRFSFNISRVSSFPQSHALKYYFMFMTRDCVRVVSWAEAWNKTFKLPKMNFYFACSYCVLVSNLVNPTTRTWCFLCDDVLNNWRISHFPSHINVDVSPLCFFRSTLYIPSSRSPFFVSSLVKAKTRWAQRSERVVRCLCAQGKH